MAIKNTIIGKLMVAKNTKFNVAFRSRVDIKGEVRYMVLKLVKVLWYGIFLSYHIKKKDNVNIKHKTVLRYHYEMALHYYEKAYGKEYE